MDLILSLFKCVKRTSTDGTKFTKIGTKFGCADASDQCCQRHTYGFGNIGRTHPHNQIYFTLPTILILGVSGTDSEQPPNGLVTSLHNLEPISKFLTLFTFASGINTTFN